MSCTYDLRRFTFSQVPRDVSDAIYGRVRGAYYDAQNEWWLVPCGQYLNITFNFGGHSFPIHPLDIVDDNFNKVDSTGKKVCIGAVRIFDHIFPKVFLRVEPFPSIVSANHFSVQYPRTLRYDSWDEFL